MKVGDTVRMTEGPFPGMYGTVIISSGHRAVLAVVLGSREVQIEIVRDWIVEATPRRPSMSCVEDPKPNQRRSG